MDNSTEHIKNSLEYLAERLGPSAIYPAIVKAINPDDTITVELASTLEIDDCRLKSVVKDGNKILLEPKLGSTVLIGAIENTYDFVVLAVEEINRMYVKVGSIEFQIKDKFLIKKGSDTLEKLISELIDEINKIVVMVGTSPNVTALSAIKERVKQLFE